MDQLEPSAPVILPLTREPFVDVNVAAGGSSTTLLAASDKPFK